MNSFDTVDMDDLLEEKETDLVRTVKKYVPWLIVIGLAILFLPLYAISLTIDADADQLNAELSNIQLTLVSEPTALPEVVALEAAVAAAQVELTELEAVYANLLADHTDWPSTAAVIRNYDVNLITLTSLAQTENRLMLSGQAVDDTAVINYARSLEDSGRFSRVVVQSITLTTPSPTPTPTATAVVTPTIAATATPNPAGDDSDSGGTGSTPQPASTATSDGRDAYEPDNTVARPIFLGEIQPRNFYPSFDVDTAVFLAKAGRYYQIETASLAPGVDTFLTVTIGERILTNDDAEPGTLSSKIAFQMAADRDGEVQIQVTNRGQYGIQMTYQLIVQEIVPTVVPTVAPTSTAVPTVTPTTAPPTPTPTTTPDLRDAYEPDNTPGEAKPIAVGQIQTHTFYPNGDVDNVRFLVKQGRHYQIATTSLALGIDTFMQVQYGLNTWQNDDYAQPGSGNFASAVCFPAASDGEAIATVSNLSQQFAANATYNISLAEVPELQIDKQQLDFGRVSPGSNPPPTQGINLTGSGVINWTAVTEAGWIGLSAASGTTPSTLTVSANSAGLAPGLYEDSITLSWATVCQHHITVTLQIENPVGFNIPHVPAESPVVAARSPAAGSVAAGSPVTGLEAGNTAVLPQRDLPAAKRNAYQSGPVEFVIILELQGGTE